MKKIINNKNYTMKGDESNMNKIHQLLAEVNNMALGNLSDAEHLAAAVGLSEDAPSTFSITEYCIALRNFLEACPNEKNMLLLCEDVAHVMKAFCENAESAPLTTLSKLSIAEYIDGLNGINREIAMGDGDIDAVYFDTESEVINSYGTEKTIKRALDDIYVTLFRGNYAFKKSGEVPDESEAAMTLLCDLIIEPFAVYAESGM